MLYRYDDVKMLSRLQERTLSYVTSNEKLILHRILDDKVSWKSIRNDTLHGYIFIGM